MRPTRFYMKFLIQKILLFSTLLFINLAFGTELDVKKIGAKGDGKSDDTPYFQKCVDLLAAKGGGTMLIPPGNYLVSRIKFTGKKYSNITITGENANILEKISGRRITWGTFKTFASRNAADGVFVFEANVSHQKNDNESIKNITISGLNFITDIKKYGFDELSHHISAHGVTNLTIKNCSFKGFLGDGIAINRGTNEQGARNAYNKNIIIDQCLFDGVKNDNRNGISIYYSDGFSITNCNFVNVTRPNMIAAIDIEADDTFNISRNGIIRNCTFKNIGGLAAIAFFQKSTDNYKNLLIENCTIDGASAPFYIVGNDGFANMAASTDIVIKNCLAKNIAVTATVIKGYNILFDSVIFENISSPVANVVPEAGASNITFQNCTFRNLKNTGGLGFVGKLKNISITGSTFESFSGNGITITNPKGIGQIKNNHFKSTLQKGSFPLITAEYKNLSEINGSDVSGNISSGNFTPINLRYFYKK